MVNKNREFFYLASKTERTDSIYPIFEKLLDGLTESNDEFLHAAWIYISRAPYPATMCLGICPQGQSKRSSRLTTSTMYSQNKYDLIMSKLKPVEAEKRALAASSFDKHLHNIVMQKMEVDKQ